MALKGNNKLLDQVYNVSEFSSQHILQTFPLQISNKQSGIYFSLLSEVQTKATYQILTILFLL